MSDVKDDLVISSLPPRQRDVFNHIIELTEEHGYPPTLAELAQAMGLRNRMTVQFRSQLSVDKAVGAGYTTKL